MEQGKGLGYTPTDLLSKSILLSVYFSDQFILPSVMMSDFFLPFFIILKSISRHTITFYISSNNSHSRALSLYGEGFTISEEVPTQGTCSSGSYFIFAAFVLSYSRYLFHRSMVKMSYWLFYFLYFYFICTYSFHPLLVFLKLLSFDT